MSVPYPKFKKKLRMPTADHLEFAAKVLERSDYAIWQGKDIREVAEWLRGNAERKRALQEWHKARAEKGVKK